LLNQLLGSYKALVFQGLNNFNVALGLFHKGRFLIGLPLGLVYKSTASRYFVICAAHSQFNQGPLASRNAQ